MPPAPIIYRKQLQILNFIKEYIRTHGFAPKLRDIAEEMELSSLATVHEHLESLEKKGMIKRKTGVPRTIEILGQKIDYISNREIDIPILGFIAAGSPIEPYTDPNATMAVPSTFSSNGKKVFVLQVRGESMIDEQIRDGDFVICEQKDDARDGEIVVALLDNGMATLKRYFKEATRIRLEPANTQMSPLFVKNVRIQGKVVGLIRRYIN